MRISAVAQFLFCRFQQLSEIVYFVCDPLIQGLRIQPSACMRPSSLAIIDHACSMQHMAISCPIRIVRSDSAAQSAESLFSSTRASPGRSMRSTDVHAGPMSFGLAVSPYDTVHRHVGQRPLHCRWCGRRWAVTTHVVLGV
jgi:hypothetical protein